MPGTSQRSGPQLREAKLNMRLLVFIIGFATIVAVLQVGLESLAPVGWWAGRLPFF
jgi:hypothetical protein